MAFYSNNFTTSNSEMNNYGGVQSGFQTGNMNSSDGNGTVNPAHLQSNAPSQLVQSVGHRAANGGARMAEETANIDVFTGSAHSTLQQHFQQSSMYNSPQPNQNGNWVTSSPQVGFSPQQQQQMAYTPPAPAQTSFYSPPNQQAQHNGFDFNAMSHGTQSQSAAQQTPSKKAKKPKAKKQKVFPDSAYKLATVNGVQGLGIMQQSVPQGYKMSNNPAQAHLFQTQDESVVQAQHFTPPPANMGFSSPPVQQMQNASLYTPQQQFADDMAAAVTSQQMTDDIYTAAAQTLKDGLVTPTSQSFGAAARLHLNGIFSIKDYSYELSAALQMFSGQSPDSLRYFLGSSQEMKRQIIANTATFPVRNENCSKLEVALKMFQAQAPEAIAHFLSLEPAVKAKVIKQYLDRISAGTKRKRSGLEPLVTSQYAGGAVGGAVLSPLSENFALQLTNSIACMDEEKRQQQARTEWEAANAKRQDDDRVAEADERVCAAAQQQSDEFDARAAAQQKSDEFAARAAAQQKSDEFAALTQPTNNNSFFQISDLPDGITSPGFEDDVSLADDEGISAEQLALDESVVPTIERNDSLSPLFGEKSSPLPIYDGDNAIDEDDLTFGQSLGRLSAGADITNPFSFDADKEVDFNNMEFGPMELSDLPPIDFDNLPPVDFDLLNGLGDSDDFDFSQLNQANTQNAYGNDAGNFFGDHEDDTTAGAQSSQEVSETVSLADVEHSSSPSNQMSSLLAPCPPVITAPAVQQAPQPQTNFTQTPAIPQQQQFDISLQQFNSPPQQFSSPPQLSQQNFQQVQQYINNQPQQAYSPPQPQQNITPAADEDDDEDEDDEEDEAMNAFITRAVNKYVPAPVPQAPAPPTQAFLQLQAQIPAGGLPPLTAAGPDRPLCPLYLASNGTNCPYGNRCNDRHYHVGVGNLGNAFALQTQHMITNNIPLHDVLQEGLKVTNHKRGARMECRNCHKPKPVTKENDGIRCTPCFKRWCKGQI